MTNQTIDQLKKIRNDLIQLAEERAERIQVAEAVDQLITWVRGKNDRT